ncbi:MAG: hypothetical protein H0X38_11910 [Planctomycetes bacterium]|nr:hypothetical protein [Planctomycetota bacterium]
MTVLHPLLLVLALIAALPAGANAQSSDGMTSTQTTQAWMPGQWVQSGNQYTWQAGHWQTSTTTTAVAGQPVWLAGRWEQNPSGGWTWIEGHYETPPPLLAQGPAQPPPQPVVQQQPVVVQQQPVVVQQPVYVQQPQPIYVSQPQTVYVQQPVYYSRPYYSEPYYCNPAPAFGIGVGIGLGLGFGFGHWGGYGGGYRGGRFCR